VLQKDSVFAFLADVNTPFSTQELLRRAHPIQDIDAGDIMGKITMLHDPERVSKNLRTNHRWDNTYTPQC